MKTLPTTLVLIAAFAASAAFAGPHGKASALNAPAATACEYHSAKCDLCGKAATPAACCASSTQEKTKASCCK
jgi:hypothetical protein